MTPGDGPSYIPNESLFISKVGEDLAITGRHLRELEYEEFSQRYGGIGDGDDHSYSRRDFFALCRGETVVSEMIFCQ